jgi:hypothetical protein
VFVDLLGASGLIGTEISVWDVFAAEMAEKFLADFFNCEPAGKALLTARRTMLAKGNPFRTDLHSLCVEQSAARALRLSDSTVGRDLVFGGPPSWWPTKTDRLPTCCSIVEYVVWSEY